MAAQSKKNNFLMQGGILAMAGILSRLIGILFRIPMVHIIGDAGMGVYSTAYSIYNILLLISSYSLPMAVSRLVSSRLSLKQFRSAKQIFFFSFLFGAALGFLAAAVMFFGADFLAGTLMNMPRAALAVRTLAPTVFVMGMLGVVRGFFQGHGTMIPTAVSQILEQILHVLISVLAGYLMFQRGLTLDAGGEANFAISYGAAGATIGTGVGALTALLFVGFIYLLYRKTFLAHCEKDIVSQPEPASQSLKLIVLTALPILISATMANLSNLIDQSIYGHFMGQERIAEYETLWGVFNAKYLLLTNLPIAIASAMSASTLPSVSAAISRGDLEETREKAGKAIRVIVLIAMPASVGLMVLGKPCFDLLFRSGTNEIAGAMMLWGAFAVLTFSLSTVCVGIMQGCGHYWTPIVNYAFALLTHIPLLYLSLYVFKWEIYGVVICYVLYALACCVFNLLSLRRNIGYRQEFLKSFVLVLASSLIMGAAAFGCYKGLYALHLGNTVSLIISILLAFVVYFAALLLTRAVQEEELLMFPKGSLLVRFAKKLHLLKTEGQA